MQFTAILRLLQSALRVQGVPMKLTLSAGATILLEASASLNAVIAQRPAPAHVVTAPSLIVGMVYGIVGVNVTVVGHTADTMGPNRALTSLCWIPLLATALIFFLLPVHASGDGARVSLVTISD